MKFANFAGSAIIEGADLEPYRKTRSRKATASSKFYFFDCGVVNYLRGIREIPQKTPLFGEVFESYIYHELRSWTDYQSDAELHYWRSADGLHEVDFLLNQEIAIECKSTHTVNTSDLKGLKSLSMNMSLKRKIVVCFETRPRKMDGIEILPWRQFLEELWDSYRIK